MIRFMPRIIEFLGYDPYPEPTTVGEEVAAKRRGLGISRKRLAKALGIDEKTLSKWERGVSEPREQQMKTIKTVLSRPLM